jgi:hypothetical protein
MSGKYTKLVSVFLISLMVVSAETAVADNGGRTTVFGADLGLGVPLGAWKNHRYVENVNQFGIGMGVALSVEGRFWNWGGMEIGGGIINMSTSDWEDYVRAQGENINTSAHLSYFNLLLKVYPLNRKPNVIKTRLGFGVVAASAKESYLGESYDYDFLKVQGGLFIGVEYVRFLNDVLAISLNTSLLVAFEGVKYADGEDKAVIALPVFLGLRFHL